MGGETDRGERGREAPRASVAVHVHYRFDPRQAFTIQAAVDLSATGVFVPFDGAHRVGAMVELVLIPPGSENALHGFGRVARLGRCPDGAPGMGVQFVSFEERDLELLESLVAGAVLEAGDADE
ncbi:MAG TPA: PilZ domain-containing protein [Anaeromyxobacteraceae bacterium]|nr:PilZ domain-containing protein [Anaeromyxobacteraceae bacterium]